MNTLSWLLLAAHSVSALKMTFALVGLLILVLAVFYFIGGINAWDDIDSERCKERMGSARVRLFTAVLFFSVAAFIPPQNTLYAIAASEIGERAAKTDTAQQLSNEALQAIRAWLKTFDPEQPKK